MLHFHRKDIDAYALHLHIGFTTDAAVEIHNLYDQYPSYGQRKIKPVIINSVALSNAKRALPEKWTAPVAQRNKP